MPNCFNQVFFQQVVFQTQLVHSATKQRRKSSRTSCPSDEAVTSTEPLPSHLCEEVVYAEWIVAEDPARLEGRP
jgi:hypothetical protein